MPRFGAPVRRCHLLLAILVSLRLALGAAVTKPATAKRDHSVAEEEKLAVSHQQAFVAEVDSHADVALHRSADQTRPMARREPLAEPLAPRHAFKHGAKHKHKFQLLAEDLTRKERGPNGFLINKNMKLADKCLDVWGAPGTQQMDRVKLAHCEFYDPKTDQKWELLPNGRLMNLHPPNLCAATQGSADGSPIIMVECDYESANAREQLWTMNADGFIRTQAIENKCIDVHGTPPESHGTDINLHACEPWNADTDQMWLFYTPPTTTTTTTPGEGQPVRPAVSVNITKPKPKPKNSTNSTNSSEEGEESGARPRGSLLAPLALLSGVLLAQL